MSRYMKTKKMFARKTSTEDQYYGNILGGPLDRYYSNWAFVNWRNQNVASVYVKFMITYFVKFFNRREVTESVQPPDGTNPEGTLPDYPFSVDTP